MPSIEYLDNANVHRIIRVTKADSPYVDKRDIQVKIPVVTINSDVWLTREEAKDMATMLLFYANDLDGVKAFG